jgi:hypothetical protein
MRAPLTAALARGDHARALGLIRQLETLDPGDPRWPQKCGDVLRTQGCLDEAASAYRRAAECYERQGFGSRSNAMRHLARSLAGQSEDLTAVHPSLDPEARRARD